MNGFILLNGALDAANTLSPESSIFQTVYAQFGAIGILLLGTFFLIKKLLQFNYTQLLNKEEEIKVLNKQFTDHLISNQATLISSQVTLLEIISKNTDGYEKMVEAYERNANTITTAFNKNSSSVDKLCFVVENIQKNK